MNRCSANMIQRNFNKITLENFRATSVMDENWLVLKKKGDFYLWNCHTHSTHLICEEKNVGERSDFYAPIAILGGKYTGEIPPILLANDVAFEVRYGVIQNGTFKKLAKVKYKREIGKVDQMDEHYIVFPGK